AGRAAAAAAARVGVVSDALSGVAPAVAGGAAPLAGAAACNSAAPARAAVTAEAVSPPAPAVAVSVAAFLSWLGLLLAAFSWEAGLAVPCPAGAPFPSPGSAVDAVVCARGGAARAGSSATENTCSRGRADAGLLRAGAR